MSQHLIDVFRTNCGATAPLELKVSGPGLAAGERRVFEHPFVFVGRHEGNCLCLADGEVSRRHAYLQQLGGRVFCVDLGSRTGIRWGGESRPAGWLRPGQQLQIGPFTLELPRTAESGEGPDDTIAEDWNPLNDRANELEFLPRITVEAGNKVLSRLHMNRMLVLVGSSPACRVRLRDAGVSTYHCSLLRTPQGVWLIDLLNGNGTFLNGQTTRWALVKERDSLQVGPYVLRVWYPDEHLETPPRTLVEIPARTPAQPVGDTSEPEQRPAPDQGAPEAAATGASVPAAAPPAELDRAGELQRDAEGLRQQLAESQAECERLREQARALEVQAAELAGLQARLEAAEAGAAKGDVLRGERDRWQAEANHLQTLLAAHPEEREQWQQRLEATQQQLAQERDAVRAAAARLDEESAALQKVRDDLAARNAEHEAALQRLQETQEQLTRSQDEALGLQAKLASPPTDQEHFDRLAAELHAAQVERDRLRTEQQTSQHAVEQALARVSDLERALTETTTTREKALEDARTSWESERQALVARLELQGHTHSREIQAAVRDIQAKAAAEREQWRQQLQGAELQLVWERKMFQEQSEQIRQQAARLQAERGRLAARLAQAESRLRAAEVRSPEEARRAAELQSLGQQAARDQVFVQLSSTRLGSQLLHIDRAQRADAAAQQAQPRAPHEREQAPVEERRKTAISQEFQDAWGETDAGQERSAVLCKTPDHVEEEVFVADVDNDGEEAAEHGSAPAAPPDEGEASAPSDALDGSAAPFEEGQPTEDTHLEYPQQQEDSRPEARQKLWRQILGFVRRK